MPRNVGGILPGGAGTYYTERMSVPLTILVLPWHAARVWATPMRHAVFVKEQGVPEEMEWDEFDACSMHAVALDSARKAQGTGRLLPVDADGYASIGRMAVAKERRGEGVGSLMIKALLTEAKGRGVHGFVLHAQISACGFYRRFGFVEAGDPFQEAGIPHVEMRLALKLPLNR